MNEQRRVPDFEALIRDARLGIIDCWPDDIDIFELEDWEIRGEPPPGDSAAAAGVPPVNGKRAPSPGATPRRRKAAQARARKMRARNDHRHD